MPQMISPMLPPHHPLWSHWLWLQVDTFTSVDAIVPLSENIEYQKGLLSVLIEC